MIAALRFLPVAFVCAAAFYSAWTWQGRTIDALADENASLTRWVTALTFQAEQSAQARQVDAARAQRELQQAQEATATVEAILTAELGECADAPLDPDLADILDGLRPSEGN